MFLISDRSFVAAFGGIFGLCLGGSIISLIEIIYFLTFKFYTMLRKFRHEFRMNYLKNLLNQKTNTYPIFNVYDENIAVDKTTDRQKADGKFLW